MKRSSIWIGIVIGVFSVFLIGFLFKTGAAIFSESASQHQVVLQEVMVRGHHGSPYLVQIMGHSQQTSHAVWPVLLQAAVLLGSLVLFLKARGVPKWIGAVFAVLCTLSLLTPLWGIVVLMLAYLIYKRIASNHNYTFSQSISAVPVTLDSSEDRGRFLDEWEQNQAKEEK